VNEEIAIKFDEYKTDLERIITRAEPLRDPNISIVKIPSRHVEEVYRKQAIMLRQLKELHPDWDYKVINIEKIFYDFLKKRRYIEKEEYARKMERKALSGRIRGSIVKDLVDLVEQEVRELNERNPSPANVPVLVLLNMHSTYPYIETGDVISRIINDKGVYVLILYVQDKESSKENPEPYKHANYTVHSYSLI